MKKLLAGILCFVLVFSFASCVPKPTIETYIKLIQDDIDKAIAEVEGTGMEMQVIARDNSLVYSYKYTTDIGIDKESLAKSLEATLDYSSETFEEVFAELQDTVSDAKSVIVEYLDKDGNLIFSKEFKGETNSSTQNETGQTAEQKIANYLDGMSSALSETADSFKDQGIEMKVYARGTAAVYSYKYTIDVDVASTKVGLTDYLESDDAKSTFESNVDAFQSLLPELESIIVEYLDKDGNIICSKEYK